VLCEVILQILEREVHEGLVGIEVVVDSTITGDPMSEWMVSRPGSMSCLSIVSAIRVLGEVGS
jgi:hypothetical protein